MLEALGYGFLDADGKQVPYGANGLALIETITDEHVMPELKECKFRIACDVTNPLCGANGCSAVFGPQKGATQTMIPKMDTWLMNYAKRQKKNIPAPIQIKQVPEQPEDLDLHFYLIQMPF